jgi:RNA polymerase subunit RPABC4/transcription elongation factor Spt4
MHNADFICPVCGAEVPAKAEACPDCGSDEKTGWSDHTVYDGTGIEDPDEFHYEHWQQQETGKGNLCGWLCWVVGVLLAGILLAYFLSR